MDLGASESKPMVHIPLSEQEEAVLELMKKVSRLEHENQTLKEEIKRLRWSMTEHD